jgi:hypothetical protein
MPQVQPNPEMAGNEEDSSWYVQKHIKGDLQGICEAVRGKCQATDTIACVFGPATFEKCDQWINENCIPNLE